jgi:hypothetical protein
MMAWVEWQFFNPSAPIVKGKNFDCSKCPLVVQKQRGCNFDNLDLKPIQAKSIPIQILENGMKHTFCPSKLHRDYPHVNAYFETLFNSYKTGTPLEELNVVVTQQVIEDQNMLIKVYEQNVRNEQYSMLARMFMGSK